MSSDVEISDSGAVRTITLNRPDVLNAFTTDMLKGLGKAVKSAAKDQSVRCVVLTGAGRAFCSGQDLAEVKDAYTGGGSLELGSQLRDFYNPIILALREMEKPVIAVVNGVAAGAGASFALACDFRLVASSASFVQAFIHVGLVPDCGGTFFLAQIVGAARAMEIAISGRKVKADEALSLGLATRIVEDDKLADEAASFAAQLAGMPTKAIALTKRAIYGAWSNDLPTHLDYEAMVQTTAGRSADHREGVLAFLEKRKPEYKGE